MISTNLEAKILERVTTLKIVQGSRVKSGFGKTGEKGPPIGYYYVIR
jgi:hypothetical protein